MNKKALIMALILACIMILNSCYTSNVKTEALNPVENAKGNSSSNSEVDSKQQGSADKDHDTIGSDLQTQELLFVLNNSLLDVDVIKFLGEPEKKSEPSVWGSDGLEHQTWYYDSKGVEIGFYKDDENKQVVFSIDLKNPCSLKTSKGISIGSTRKEVLKAYEKEINPEENRIDSESIVAGTVYGGLVFAFEDDKVSSIFIGAAAE